MSGTKKRLLRLRRPQTQSPKATELSIVALQGMVDTAVTKTLNDIREEVGLMADNAHTVHIVLIDLAASLNIAATGSGSTKSRLEELIENQQAAFSNLSKLKTVGQFDLGNLERVSGISSGRPQVGSVYGTEQVLQSMLDTIQHTGVLHGEGSTEEEPIGLIDTEEDDDIMDGVSESEGFTVRPRRTRR